MSDRTLADVIADSKREPEWFVTVDTVTKKSYWWDAAAFWLRNDNQKAYQAEIKQVPKSVYAHFRRGSRYDYRTLRFEKQPVNMVIKGGVIMAQRVVDLSDELTEAQMDYARRRANQEAK